MGALGYDRGMTASLARTHRDRSDPTVYRVEDDLGEHEIQTYILELLRPLVERYLAEHGVRAHVGADQYIYWEKHDPSQSVAPDLYVLPGVSQELAIDVWKVWERGVVPNLTIEVVCSHPRKDYEQAPLRHAELGVKELVVFDPFPRKDRKKFHVYRRSRRGFRMVEATDADRVRSRELGCYLRAVGEAHNTRLRLALGARGEDLFPTAEEAERAAKEAALLRVAELEAELARRNTRR